MRIEDSKGNELTELRDWQRLHEPKKWKRGRSAWSVADFVVNQGGAERLRRRVSSVLDEPVAFVKIIPEYEVRFDRYGKGRFHDLGIHGTTTSGGSLFVGVEAKVDETFGDYVGSELRKAEQRLESGNKTKMPERIRGLCARFSDAPRITRDSCKVRYQLLHGVAGTLDAGAEVSVFYVAVFRTRAYDDSVGDENRREYLRFIECAEGQGIGAGKGSASAHLLSIGGKRLFSIHEYFDMP